MVGLAPYATFNRKLILFFHVRQFAVRAEAESYLRTSSTRGSLTIENRQSKIRNLHMYPAGNLFIPASHGQLEAILKESRTGDVRGVALVLHPHPLGGGTMHNKVVFRAAAALNDAGLVTLR